MKLVPHYWLIYCNELHQQRYYMQIIITPEGSIISLRNFLQKAVTTIIFYLFTLLYQITVLGIGLFYPHTCVHVLIHSILVSLEARKCHRIPGTEGLEGCKLPCAHQKLNPDQWKSSQVLLTSEPALEPHAFKKGFILAYSLSRLLLIQ